MSIRNEGQPQYVRFTRARAKIHQAMQECPGNRDFSPKRLKDLKHELEQGQFRHPIWAVCFCKETKLWYRLNGNHSSQMLLSLTDDEIAQNGREIFIGIERFSCDTLDEVATLYSTYDSKINSRTQNDINKSFAKSDDALSDVPNAIVNRCCTALSMDKTAGYGTLSQADRGRLLLKHADFVLWVKELFGVRGASYEHMDRGPVFKAMYETFKQSPKVAREFWSLVRGGGSSTTNYGKLYKFLLSKHLSNRPGKANGNRISATECYEKCIDEWNTWCSKNRHKAIRILDESGEALAA